MESDIRYYRRRAIEEMSAARGAVTEAARQRRLQLVDLYIRHLKALHEPSPFDDRDLVLLASGTGHPGDAHSPFAWPGTVAAPAA